MLLEKQYRKVMGLQWCIKQAVIGSDKNNAQDELLSWIQRDFLSSVECMTCERLNRCHRRKYPV